MALNHSFEQMDLNVSINSTNSSNQNDQNEYNRPSLMLSRFHQDRSQSFQLGQIFGHVVEFSCDKSGSKLLQLKFHDAPEHRKRAIFSEMKPVLVYLMMNKYANFVVQKFFAVATVEQKSDIVSSVCENFHTLAIDSYGCRVIQFLIETIPNEERISLMQHLWGKVIEYSCHEFAHYIVCKCFSHIFSTDYLNFIVNEFKGNMVAAAKHTYAYQVLEAILEFGTSAQRNEIINEIALETISVIEDRFGNYVIQNILRHQEHLGTALVLITIGRNFARLCKDKYASNVVEKLLETNGDIPITFIQSLLQMNDHLFLQLCVHPFANYVVQKLITFTDTRERAMLRDKLRPFTRVLLKHRGAKNILNSLHYNHPILPFKFEEFTT